MSNRQFRVTEPLLVPKVDQPARITKPGGFEREGTWRSIQLLRKAGYTVWRSGLQHLVNDTLMTDLELRRTADALARKPK